MIPKFLMFASVDPGVLPLDVHGIETFAGRGAEFAAWLTHLGEPWLCLPLCVLFLAFSGQWRQLSVARLVGVGLVLLIIVQGLKFGLDRPRPGAVLQEVLELSGGGLKARAMPSGHTAMAAYVFGLLGMILWRQRWGGTALVVGLVTPLVVAWSRIAIGAHWPTDVLAGLCLGFVLAMAALGRASRPPQHTEVSE